MLGLGIRRRCAGTHGPDNVKIVEMSPTAASAALQTRQHSINNAGSVTDQQDHAVGNLAG